MSEHLDSEYMEKLYRLCEKDAEAVQSRVIEANLNPLTWFPAIRRRMNDQAAKPILDQLSTNTGNQVADVTELGVLNHLRNNGKFKKLRRDLVEQSFIGPDGKPRGPVPGAPAATWMGGFKDVLQPDGTFSGLAVWAQKRLGNDAYSSLMNMPVRGLIDVNGNIPQKLNFAQFIDLAENQALNQKYKIADRNQLMRSLDDWAEGAQKLHGRNSNYQKVANLFKAKVAVPTLLAGGAMLHVNSKIDKPKAQDAGEAAIGAESPYKVPEGNAGDAFMKQQDSAEGNTYRGYNNGPTLGPALNPMFGDSDTSDWAKYVKSSSNDSIRLAQLVNDAPPDFNSVVSRLKQIVDSVDRDNVVSAQRELREFLVEQNAKAEAYLKLAKGGGESEETHE